MHYTKSKLIILTALILTLTSAIIFPQNKKVIDSLNKRIINSPDTSKVILYIELMKQYAFADFNKSLEYGNKALKLSQDINYKFGVAKSLNGIGIIYNLKGNIPTAIEYYKKSLKMREAIGDKIEIAGSLNNIGIAYFNTGKYTEALKYYLKALKLREEIGNQDDISGSYNNIGSLYMDMDEFDKALEFYNKALNIRKNSTDKNDLANTLSNIGAVYSKKGEDEKALPYYQRALKLQNANGNKKESALTLNNIGIVYSKKKKYNQALEYLQSAYKIRHDLDDKSGEAETLNNLAFLLKDMGNLSEALKDGLAALKIAQEINAKSMEKSIDKNLSLIYAKLNDFKAAYDYQDKYLTLSDSLLNLKRSKQMEEMQNQYSEGQNELQIKLQKAELKHQRLYIYIFSGSLILLVILAVILIKNNKDKQKTNILLENQKSELADQQEIINQKNKDLEETNSIKDKLFAVIAHDLRNPFASLKGLVDLLNMKELTISEFKEYVSELESDLNSTSNLLDNLLTWSVSQIEERKSKPSKLDLTQVTDSQISVVKKLAENKSINLINKVEAETFAIADPDMINLVVRNLLTNAIKFTGEKGLITISSNKRNGYIEVSVSDNGIGIPPAEQNKLFDISAKSSSKGTKGERGSGLGLGLCKEFIETNGGKIWVHSVPGAGSTFTFQLRSADQK